MKFLLTILLFFSSKLFCQTYAVWTTTDERFVKNYVLQSSSDNNNWQQVTTFDPMKKDTNVYSYTIVNDKLYYRVKENTTLGLSFTSESKQYQNKPPTISINPNNQTISLQ